MISFFTVRVCIPANRVLIDPDYRGCKGITGEIACLLRGTQSHAASERIVTQQPEGEGRELLLGMIEKAVLSVFQHAFQCIVTSAEQGQPIGQSLQNTHAVHFKSGSGNKHIPCGKIAPDLYGRDSPGEEDVPLQLPLFCQSFQTPSVGSISDNQQFSIRIPFEKLRKIRNKKLYSQAFEQSVQVRNRNHRHS